MSKKAQQAWYASEYKAGRSSSTTRSSAYGSRHEYVPAAPSRVSIDHGRHHNPSLGIDHEARSVLGVGWLGKKSLHRGRYVTDKMSFLPGKAEVRRTRRSKNLEYESMRSAAIGSHAPHWRLFGGSRGLSAEGVVKRRGRPT